MTGTPSEAMIGYGSKLEVETAAGSGVYFKLGEIVRVGPPGSKVDKVEVTHMESPDRTKEFIAGLKEYSTIDFPLNWIPGNDTDDFILAWQATGERRSTRVTYPNGVADTFLSYVDGYTGEVPIADKMSATLTLQVAGANARA